MTRIAVVQMCASTEKDANLRHILECIDEAAKNGAQICAFPEYMMFYTTSDQTPTDVHKEAEAMDGNFVSSIIRKAKEVGIEVVGTIYESSPTGKAYDTAFLLDGSGVRLVYRKTHLYDALGFKESDKLEAGDSLVEPTDSAAGKAGMMICYDLRFPEVARGLAEAQAQIIFAPSAWVQGEGKVEHWQVMNRARALENGCFVVSPAHTGNIYCGHSMVTDPTGKVLLEMTTDPGMAYVDIDTDRVSETRKVLPLLKNRRLDIYPHIFRPQTTR